MSVLAQDAPALPELELPAGDGHAIAVSLQALAIVAVAVYLSLGVTWWFAPLSVLLIGVTAWAGLGQNTATVRRRQRVARTALAEVPVLTSAGQR